MSDLGETFKALREESSEKRHRNLEESLALLTARGIEFKMLTDYHVRVGNYDFWPSTGMWSDCRNKRSTGRGVLGLLIKLEKERK